MLNKIKMYIGYWLLMLYFYRYRKVFVRDWLILKKSFKVISHAEDYDSATVCANYVLFVTTNNALHEMVEAYKCIRKNRY